MWYSEVGIAPLIIGYSKKGYGQGATMNAALKQKLLHGFSQNAFISLGMQYDPMKVKIVAYGQCRLGAAGVTLIRS